MVSNENLLNSQNQTQDNAEPVATIGNYSYEHVNFDYTTLINLSIKANDLPTYFEAVNRKNIYLVSNKQMITSNV